MLKYDAFPHQKGLKLGSGDGVTQAGAVMGKRKSSPGPGFMGGGWGQEVEGACAGLCSTPTSCLWPAQEKKGAWVYLNYWNGGTKAYLWNLKAKVIITFQWLTDHLIW